MKKNMWAVALLKNSQQDSVLQIISKNRVLEFLFSKKARVPFGVACHFNQADAGGRSLATRKPKAIVVIRSAVMSGRGQQPTLEQPFQPTGLQFRSQLPQLRPTKASEITGQDCEAEVERRDVGSVAIEVCGRKHTQGRRNGSVVQHVQMPQILFSFCDKSPPKKHPTSWGKGDNFFPKKESMKSDFNLISKPKGQNCIVSLN